MASLIPISTYNLALVPFNPVPAVEDDFPITVRITMAAVDPEATDDKEEPSTVRILKRARPFIDDEDLDELEAEEGDDEEDELDSEEEEEVEEPKKSKKSKKVEEDDEDEEDEEDDEDDSDIEDDEEIEEFVLCTLSPKVQFQQSLDFTISPNEEVHFVVTGSYPVHLTGNYVEHPADDEDDFDSDEDEYYEDDEDEYNLTPDEDELIDIEDLEDASDIESKITELVEEEIKRKRSAEDSSDNKKNKKAKDNKKEEKKEEKKVKFTKELEQGPTPSKKDKKEKKKEEKKEKKEEKTEKKEEKSDKKDKKFPTNTLLGGVVTEDRKVGSGAGAKSGNKVGIRYIGKLKNGKVFDKNTSGKPFVFNLGKGECIKGFDLGVAGMAVGGERRVVIPAKMGYGSQALPGIPANSELTFDIKLVSLK
ncbi:CIC11C00000001268 [Sungouiella intermedia]|uniref:FK506-binding protein n=1 Tax=Sungouiella intermedia TaxID=45354 RepID=A0A1L0BE49_9ASCO|nr:CIC11C00000001268 [[Candida] intermedia]SGZ49360.1 CIC11C00000000101 [[Candida] intermedia]